MSGGQGRRSSDGRASRRTADEPEENITFDRMSEEDLLAGIEEGARSTGKNDDS